MEANVSQAESGKLEGLCQRLRALARERGPGIQLPTTRVLCKMLQTTRATLDDALTILENERIIYRKQRQGIFVSPEVHHKSIHILFSAIDLTEPVSPFWNMLWMELERESQRRAAFKKEFYTIHVVHPLKKTEHFIPEHIHHLLRTQRVDGVLAVGFHIQEKDVNLKNIPHVVFAGVGAHEVCLDEQSMISQAIEILVLQGCEKIGIWIQKIPFLSLEERQEIHYFKQTLMLHNKKIYPELMRMSHMFSDQKSLSLQEQGYLFAKEIFGGTEKERPDGLLINNDMMTDGALIALDELGIRIGEDIKIVTHANVGSPVLFGRTKHMTALEFSPALIAQAMFSLLENVMMHPPMKKQVIYIKPQIRKALFS